VVEGLYHQQVVAVVEIASLLTYAHLAALLHLALHLCLSQPVVRLLPGVEGWLQPTLCLQLLHHLMLIVLHRLDLKASERHCGLHSSLPSSCLCQPCSTDSKPCREVPQI